jgi:hypothetical protein
MRGSVATKLAGQANDTSEKPPMLQPLEEQGAKMVTSLGGLKTIF